MIRNYLKIAYRTLIRNKTFSLVNLTGLVIGTTCALYILLFIQYHRNFDRHHKDGDRIYRVISDLELSGEKLNMATCSPPIVNGMKEDLASVEQVARVVFHPALEQNLMRIDNRVFYEQRGAYVDSTFFQLFNYNFIEGDPLTSLNEPYSVVISEELAEKLFSGGKALNEVIHIDGGGEEKPFKIKGVFNADLGRSHLMPTFFMSMNSGGIGQFIRENNSWAGNNFIYGYVKLQNGTDVSELEARLPDFLQARGGDQLRDLGMGKVMHLQPLSEIHTGSGLTADRPDNISLSFLRLLFIIAAFIQLVACINFMNLTTARSLQRAREVGVRKTMGAPRGHLIGQFLGESFLLTTFSMLLALPILHFLMPLINRLTGISGLTLDLNIPLLSMVGIIIVITGFLAGSYPAFYLSSFKPLSVLRGRQIFSTGKGSGLLRKGLVVSQFTIATILVTGALIIRSQLQYIHNKDLGFDKNHKIIFSFQSEQAQSQLDNFKTILSANPEVLSASAMSKYPGQNLVQDIPMYKQGLNMQQAVDIRCIYADSDFFKTLKIKMLTGRELTPADTVLDRSHLKVILNESAVKELDIPAEEAPGQLLYSQFEDINLKATIIGVMEDVLYQNLSQEMGPFMVIGEPTRNLQYLVADISTGDYPGFIQKAENAWKEVLPTLPFEFSFLDENIQALYESEQALSRIIGIFTFMAIFISCLGIFGLSVFAAEKRIKEIGIRKVLGATPWSIVRLLSRDFLLLILIACILAVPVAYYFMDQWLSEFAYRINLSWKFFVLSALAALTITFLTVSIQSIRAATMNPSRTLNEN